MANRGRPKGQKRTGGRKKGTPNKVTADVKALAGNYSAVAVETLAAIMGDKDQPAAARVAAAKELLDRAHGKVPQGIGLAGGNGDTVAPRRVIIELTNVD